MKTCLLSRSFHTTFVKSALFEDISLWKLREQFHVYLTCLTFHTNVIIVIDQGSLMTPVWVDIQLNK